MQSSALTCAGSRVLTPKEVVALQGVISKPSNRALFDLMLFTGLRLEEVRQLHDNPGIFVEDRKYLVIKSGKDKAIMKSREVKLCDKGMEAVRAFLISPKMPVTSSAWQTNLIRWCKAAHIKPLPGIADDAPGNRYGITCRTSRKTLESWLLVAYPAHLPNIALSQGHNEVTSLKHYMSAGFTQAEKEIIPALVTGWI